MEKVYIKEGGKLIPANESNLRVYCGLYAAVGYNGTTAGDLFAVMSGPALAPAYDENGSRINVGEEYQGMSYRDKIGWYKE